MKPVLLACKLFCIFVILTCKKVFFPVLLPFCVSIVHLSATNNPNWIDWVKGENPFKHLHKNHKCENKHAIIQNYTINNILLFDYFCKLFFCTTFFVHVPKYKAKMYMNGPSKYILKYNNQY